MCARVYVGGESLEGITVENGLRKGYTMEPVVFNLYACPIAEWWSARVKDNKGMGAYLRYKLDYQLVRWSTRNAGECHPTTWSRVGFNIICRSDRCMC